LTKRFEADNELCNRTSSTVSQQEISYTSLSRQTYSRIVDETFGTKAESTQRKKKKRKERTKE
jgi:hypothetical protein